MGWFPPGAQARNESPLLRINSNLCLWYYQRRLVFPSFHEALFAVNRSVSAGLEWDFRLLSALRTNGLVHFPWAEISALSTKASASSAWPVAKALFLKWHSIYLLLDSWDAYS